MKLFDSIFGGGGGQPSVVKRGRGNARTERGQGVFSGGGGRNQVARASGNRGVGINSAPGEGARNAAALRRAGEAVRRGGRAR